MCVCVYVLVYLCIFKKILRTSSPILLAITVTCFLLCFEEDHLA